MSPTGPNKFQIGVTPERIHERKSEKFSVLCQYKLIAKFDANILQDDREKCRKLNLNKGKYLVCNQVKHNKSQS